MSADPYERLDKSVKELLNHVRKMEEKPPATLIEKIGFGVAASVIFVVIQLYHAWALMVLWNWFIVPWAEPVGFLRMVGVMTLFALLTVKSVTLKKEDLRINWNACLFAPITAVAIGWLVRQW